MLLRKKSQRSCIKKIQQAVHGNFAEKNESSECSSISSLNTV